MPRSKKQEMDLVEVAYLYANRGLTQRQIGEKLSEGLESPLEQGTISRRLKQAKKEGYYTWPERPTRTFEKKNVKWEYLKQIEKKYEFAELRSELLRSLVQESRAGDVSTVQSLDIVPSLDEGNSRRSIETLASEAATDVLSYLDEGNGKVVGIGWGYTIHYVVKALEAQLGEAKWLGIRVVPLAGEPLHLADGYPLQLAAASIAARFAKASGGEMGNLPPFPVYVPREFGKAQELKTIRRFFAGIPAYKEVFGHLHDKSDVGLAGKLDTVLTSVGTVATSGSDGGSWLESILDREFATDDWRSWIVGDMGGVLFPRPGLDPAKARLVEDLNERALGIRLTHYQDCAARCARKKQVGAGVIVISQGDRSEVLRQAVQAKAINRLVLDQSAAEALQNSYE